MNQATFVLPSSCSLVVFGLMQAGSAWAGIDDAKHWLSAQTTPTATSALDLQTIDERLRTLSLLHAGNLTPVDLTALLDGDHSTEALVRAATISHRQQAGLAQTTYYLTQVLAHQNPDGGFGHLAGWQSNPLDTAYVLLALADTQLISQLSSTTEIARWNTAIQQAVQYLLSQQQANGSYQVVSLDQLYVSAYVLSALTAYATTYAQTTPSILRLVAFLQAAQIAPAQWSQHAQGLLIDALVAESLHPYQPTNQQSLEQAFRNRVDALQQQNSSWSDDPYLTAIILHSLARQSTPAENPITSGVQFRLLDGETSSFIADAQIKITPSDPTKTVLNISSLTHGEVTIKNIQPDNYLIHIIKSGYSTLSFRVQLNRGEQQNLGVLKLSRQHQSNVAIVQGKITDQLTHLPIVGAQVKLKIDDQILNAVTNTEGLYQLTLTTLGSFNLEVSASRYQPLYSSGQAIAGGTFQFSPQLSLEEGTSTILTGRVLNPRSSQPLANVKVLANGQLVATTDQDGYFYTNNLITPKSEIYDFEKYMPSGFVVKPTTDFILEFVREHFIAAKNTVSPVIGKVNDLGLVGMYPIDPSQPNQLPIELVPSILNISLQDLETQTPITGARITAQQLDSSGHVLKEVSASSAQATLQAELTSGTWKIFAERYNYHPSEVITYQSRPHEQHAITLGLSKIGTGTVTFNIKDQSSNLTISNAKIFAERLDAQNNVVEDFNLQQKIEDQSHQGLMLKEGRWRFKISHPAYQESAAQLVTITKTAPQHLNFSLAVKPYALSGTLVDSISNQALSGQSIRLINKQNKAVLKTVNTDAQGRFLFSNITQPNIYIEIQPERYLSTTRYFERQSTYSELTDIGEVRIRPKSAENLLPDLKINRIITDHLTTNSQTLVASGWLSVELENIGNTDLQARSISAIAFEDINKNRQLDPEEKIWGRQRIHSGLAMQARMLMDIPIAARPRFWGAPITVMIDDQQQIPESNKTNNVRSTSDGVEIKPPIGTFEPQEIWHYGFKEADPQKPLHWKNFGSSASPVAAPLMDTNQDGRIGLGDRAAIIYMNYAFDMVAIDGKDGSELWKVKNNAYINNVGNQIITNAPAIADVDQDGQPDVVVLGNNELLVYSHLGKLKKKWSTGVSGNFYINDILIADLDQDRVPEIMVGNTISDYHQGVKHRHSFGAALASADLDGDGLQEIITNTNIVKYSVTTSIKTQSLASYAEKRFAAIGSFSTTEAPTVVLTGDEFVTFYRNFKQVARYPITAGGRGGAPTLGDFDGDHVIDIGLAGANAYVVMRNDGSILWSAPVQDESSNVTGSSIFDIDGDGKTEVVYGDEDYLRIYDAKTGQELYRIINSSHTAHEAPIIVDADADGHADILFVSNSPTNDAGRAGKTAGIRMLSGKNKDWAATRNIWNQYSYHVTNINDDLSVPQFEPNSWDVHNTYRANWLPTNSVAAADLTASLIQIEDNGWFGSSTLKARVGNAGGKRVPAGTPVAFYRIAPAINGVTPAPVLLHVATLSQALEAGDYEDVEISYSGSLADFGELVVIANDAGAGIESLSGIPAGQTNALVIQEYTRANNIARLSIGGGFQSYTLSSSLDQATYQPNQNVQITAQAANLGSFDADATIRMTVLDQVGNVLSVLPSQQVTLVAAPDQATTVTGSWNTGNHRIGAYVVRIELIRPSLFGDAEVVATSTQSFHIGSGAAVDTGLTDPRLFADKATYNNVDVINATLQLRNTANNEVAGGRTTTVELVNASGTVLWSTQTHLDQLSPNALDEQHWQIPLNQVDTGLYVLRSTTRADDGRQTDQVRNKTLTVVSNASTLIGVTGTLESSQSQVNVGDMVNLTWSVHNQGSAIHQLPTRIVLINENTGQRVGMVVYQGHTQIAQNSSTATQTLVWSSTIDAAQIDQPLMVMLQVQAQNGRSGEDSWQALAYRPLKISQPPLKIEIGVDGQDGELSPASGAPLLVYYSCHEGWNTLVHNWSLGKFTDSCFATRAAQIKPYLDRLNIPYTLVKEPWQFRTQLRSGVYGQYWMLGAVEQLQHDAFYELREAAHLGDGLLVDSGMHSWSNEHLFALAGADPKGRLRLADGVLTVQPIANTSIVPPLLQAPSDPQVAAAPLTTITPRRGQPLSTNWPALLETLTPHTQVAATFDGRHRLEVWWASLLGGSIPQSTYPAITTAPYGQGYPVGVAFDLISTLQHASTTSAQPNYSQQRWDQVLKDFSRPRRSAVRSSYVPAEVVRIPVTLNNQSSSSRTLTVVVDLPAGSTWQSAEGGLDALQNGQPSLGSAVQQVRFNVTIPAQTTRTKQLTLRLPKTAGTAVVRTRVYSEQNGTTSSLLAQQESRFVVRSIEERLALIKQTINQWRILGADGVQVTLLKVKVGLVEKHLRLGLIELAIDETAIMGATLALMSQTANPQVRSTRLETGELLKALEMKWYLDNPDKKAK